MFTAIFTSWPIEKWGVTLVTLAGSILTSLGLIMSAFAPNVAVLIVTYGIFAGKQKLEELLFSFPLVEGADYLEMK